jgi:hypothetical protein
MSESILKDLDYQDKTCPMSNHAIFGKIIASQAADHDGQFHYLIVIIINSLSSNVTAPAEL